MKAKVDALRDLLGEGCLIDAGMGFWRDAYCAAAFGELRGAEKVRLTHPEPRPDFEALVAGKVHAVEVTEADYPGRRRGDEYRQHGDQLYGFEPMDPELAWRMLRAAAKLKADGRYGREVELLVLLNGSDFSHARDEIVALMPDALAPAAAHFAHIWVLWKGELHCVASRDSRRA